MLSFFRNNSIKIVYGIVLSFVITTFFGVVFFNDSFRESNNQKQAQLDIRSAIATIGNLPVKSQTYGLELRRLQSSLPPGQSLTLQQYEQFQMNALNRAIENTLLIEYGKKIKEKVSRSEVNVSILSVMEQFNVNSKNDLKTAIRQAGGSYENMVNQLKEDILASKIRDNLLSEIQINDEDINNINTKFKIKELFVSKYSTQNLLIEKESLLAKVNEIKSQITDSTSLSDQINKIYEEYGVKKPEKDSYWIEINQRSPNVMRQLYNFELSQISEPIEISRGYLIIELIDKEKNITTSNLTEDVLLSNWKNNHFYNELFSMQNNRELKIIEPELRALRFKYEGQFEKAIAAYQALISREPTNPYPNYLISQIYSFQGNLKDEKQELLVAEIKESLNGDQIIFPQIHLRLAEIYEEEKAFDKRDLQYDKLLANSDNVSLLNNLVSIFEKNKDKKRKAIAENLIEQATSTDNVTIEDNPFESVSLESEEN